MRRLKIMSWAMLPMVLLAVHLYWGRGVLKRQEANATAAIAVDFAKKGRWVDAKAAYERAISTLKPIAGQGDPELLRLELQAVRVSQCSGDIEGSVKVLRSVLEGVSMLGPQQDQEVRAAIAETSYYTAWLMRRGGIQEVQWRPLAVGAREQLEHLKQSGLRSSELDRNLARVVAFESATDEVIRAKPFPKPELAALFESRSLSIDDDKPAPQMNASRSGGRSGSEDPNSSAGNSHDRPAKGS